MLSWTRYGGVPIISKVLGLNTQGDSIFKARNSDSETFKFIDDECAAIAGDLPTKPERVSKGAALTLKSWCELFEASPFKNPYNDKNKWALAAVTNKEFMNLDVYRLFPNYQTLFYEENNNNAEVIFDRAYVGGTSIGASKDGLWSIRFGNPPNAGAQTSWSATLPSQGI